MSPFNKKLNRIDGRLAAYATLAGAALAAPAIPSADATIVYSGVVNINIPSTTAGIYLNLLAVYLQRSRRRARLGCQPMGQHQSLTRGQTIPPKPVMVLSAISRAVRPQLWSTMFHSGHWSTVPGPTSG